LPKSASKKLRKRIDWPAARAEYVNNAALTYAEVAEKYHAHVSNVRTRAARENWTGERTARTTFLLQKVAEKSTLDAVAELARYNEQDLMVAKALRSLAAKKMQQAQQGNMEPRDIRALAGAIESAQRIARLALGASTENSLIHETNVPPIDLRELNDAEFAAFRLLVGKAASADRAGDEPPSGETIQ
jgi:hypothetical protein